jgi:hypothetical protein
MLACCLDASATERGKFYELNHQPFSNAWNGTRSAGLFLKLLILEELGEEGAVFCELQMFCAL